MSKTERSLLVSSRLESYFRDYASSHKTKGNQLTHYFGISFIVVSILGLLGGITLGENFSGLQYLRCDGGTLLLSIGILLYHFLDWRIAIPFAFVLAGAYFLGRALPVFVNAGLFVVGWIFQAIGHVVYEKKAPSFFKNVLHLFIGPLWIFAKVIGYR